MSLECIIDNRERGLIKLLNNIPDEVRITIDTLDVGDIVFRNDSSIVLVIERKTVADLDASIIDGRHREQKARLFASESRFMYVIEGDIRKSINYEVASGSIINTMFRDGLQVYKTMDINETALFVRRLYKKLQVDINIYWKEGISVPNKDVDYSSKLKVKKKDNLTPNVWYINMLASIPRVSNKTANVIVQQYPTLQLLLEAYQITNNTELLCDIKYKNEGGKEVKLGKVLAKNVYRYVCNM